MLLQMLMHVVLWLIINAIVTDVIVTYVLWIMKYIFDVTIVTDGRSHTYSVDVNTTVADGITTFWLM